MIRVFLLTVSFVLLGAWGWDDGPAAGYLTYTDGTHEEVCVINSAMCEQISKWVAEGVWRRNGHDVLLRELRCEPDPTCFGVGWDKGVR